MYARVLPVLALALGVLGAAEPARGISLPFRGELFVDFGFLGTFVVVEGAGVAEVGTPGLGGPVTALALPAGVFATRADFPGTGAIGGLRVAGSNGPGSFTPLGGGAMPLQGSARICFFAGCDTATLSLELPLSPVGAGGTAAVTGPVSVTLRGAPWTLGTITVSRPGAVTIVSGAAAGPASLPGSTAQPGGVLEWVTPIFIETTLTGLEDLDTYAVLRIAFVPEPTSLVLLGAGIAALAGCASRRRGAAARGEARM